jgi:arginine-tRNA-protein transferase
VGFFDIGQTSAAGIASFYDPAYKKFSLGKYLIYLKIEYCKKIGLQFFYPGYFVPGYSLFDYKLSIGEPVLQYLEFPSLEWRAFSTFKQTSSPLHVMQEKLGLLSILLRRSGLESQILKYEFFDANLIPELEGIVLFDFPIFLMCTGLAEETPIVYDVRDHQYHLIKCKSVWASAGSGNSKDLYASHVFKFDHEIFSTEHPESMAFEILKEFNSAGRTESARSKVI